MARWDNTDMNNIRGDAEVVDTALSAYEKAVFEKFLHKQAAENAQTQVANDAAPDTLRYLFAIFH